MFDVGDLPVQTFGDCVMCINDRGDQVVFKTTLHTCVFNVFNVFSKSKNMIF